MVKIKLDDTLFFFAMQKWCPASVSDEKQAQKELTIQVALKSDSAATKNENGTTTTADSHNFPSMAKIMLGHMKQGTVKSYEC